MIPQFNRIRLTAPVTAIVGEGNLGDQFALYDYFPPAAPSEFDGSFLRIAGGARARVRMANGQKASIRLANGLRL